MLAPVLVVEVGEIEPASELGELFKADVLEKTSDMRPCEETSVIVLGEDGQENHFYVKHTLTKGVDQFGKEVVKEDFVLVALRPTTLKAIVIDLRKKAPS